MDMTKIMFQQVAHVHLIAAGNAMEPGLILQEQSGVRERGQLQLQTN